MKTTNFFLKTGSQEGERGRRGKERRRREQR
jgi:hypothetical protein